MTKLFLIVMTLAFNFVLSNIAEAKAIKVRAKHPNKEAHLILDHHTGKILYSKHANERRHPASLTKMMTLYKTFEAINQKKLRVSQVMKTSSYAASKPRCKLGLRPGETLTVKDAILSLIVRSANDSSVVLAETLAGSESKFAIKMNETAKRLGMKNTNFANSTGLFNKNQYSTAFDMAKLAIALKKDFPEYYDLFSRLEFEFKGNMIKTHNHVTRLYPGAKGMKTGYIDAAGFNLVTTVERGNKYLLGVVLGGKTAASRDQMMMSLLDKHFTTKIQTVAANFTLSQSKVANPTPERVKANVIQSYNPSSKIDEIGNLIAKVEAEENKEKIFSTKHIQKQESKIISRSKTPKPFVKAGFNSPQRQMAAK